MGINEAYMDKHCCPDTVEKSLECNSIVRSTIIDHYKEIHLNIDYCSRIRRRSSFMISWNLRFIYFKTLLSKYIKYIQDRLQQIIQSRSCKYMKNIAIHLFQLAPVNSQCLITLRMKQSRPMRNWKIVVHTILEMINCSRSMSNHQVYKQRM